MTSRPIQKTHFLTEHYFTNIYIFSTSSFTDTVPLFSHFDSRLFWLQCLSM